MPDQTQVEPDVRGDGRSAEAGRCDLLVYIIEGAVELQVPREIEIRAQLKLVRRVALKSAVVRMQIHVQPRVAGDETPVLQHFPLRGDLGAERFRRAGILHRLGKHHDGSLNKRSAGTNLSRSSY